MDRVMRSSPKRLFSDIYYNLMRMGMKSFNRFVACHSLIRVTFSHLLDAEIALVPRHATLKGIQWHEVHDLGEHKRA
jgi:hypothetical protein